MGSRRWATNAGRCVRRRDRRHPYFQFMVHGPGAARWLDGMLAGRLPTVGSTLALMLNEQGGYRRFLGRSPGRDTLQLTASYAAQAFISAGSTSICPMTAAWWWKTVGRSVGPAHRRCAPAIAGAGGAGDVGGRRPAVRGPGGKDLGVTTARVLRVSYTGDLGYEISGVRRGGRRVRIDRPGRRPWPPAAWPGADEPAGKNSLAPGCANTSPTMGRRKPTVSAYGKAADFIGKPAALAQRGGRRQLAPLWWRRRMPMFRAMSRFGSMTRWLDL